MSSEAHPLHVAVAKLFRDCVPTDCKLIEDEACGGDQQIPLFVSTKKSRETEFCDVDLLVIKSGKIRIVVEIEESNVGPTQICGKYLTTALSRYYIHETMGNEPVGMYDAVTFIQIVDSSRVKADETSKFGQWKRLEHSIQSILPVKRSGIANYQLFYVDGSDFENAEVRSDLAACIREACK